MSTWTDGTPVDSAEELLRTLTIEAGRKPDKDKTRRMPMELFLWILHKQPDYKTVIKTMDDRYMDLRRHFDDFSPDLIAEVLHRVVAAAAKDLDRGAPFYAQGLRRLLPAPYNTKTA